MISVSGEPEEVQEQTVNTDRRSSDNARTFKSGDLFHGRREICIDHNGAVYRLKITRQDKLVLNK